jgi:predicted lipoprotein with Yx(FWY)xxD motif
MKRAWPWIVAWVLAAGVLVGFGLGQEAAGPVTVQLDEHEAYGEILTDDAGRSLYLFVNEALEATDGDTMMEGIRGNAAPCVGGCLTNWPPLTAASVTAGEGIDADLLYVEDVDGRNQVVYNGWPLYYFANDAEPGDANGQGLGGGGNLWYLVDAEGRAVTEAAAGN